MSRFAPRAGDRSAPEATGSEPSGTPAERRQPLDIHLSVHVEGGILARIDRELARKFEVVPIQQLGDTLLVASERSLEPEELNELRRRAGTNVHVIRSQVASFDATLRALYDDDVLRDRDKSLGETLIELGLLTEQHLAQALAHQMRENNPSFSPVLSIDPALLHVVPEEVARKYSVLPLYRTSDSLMLAASEHLTEQALRDLEQSTGLRPASVVVGPDALQDALAACYQVHQRYELRQMWLGEILISRGLITRRALDLCLAAQKTSRRKLGQLLVANDYISEDALFPILAEKLGMDYRRFEDEDVAPELTHLVSERFAERNVILPLRLDHDRNALEVAISDPTNLQVRDMLEGVAESQGAKLELVLSGPTRIREAIRHTYELNRRMEVDLDDLEIGTEADPEKEGGPQAVVAEELPKMQRIVNKLLYEAVTEGASDIHIENLETRTLIRFRIDGILHERTTPINKSNIRKVIAVLKIDSGLNIAGPRQPQDGVFRMRIGQERNVDFRINLHSTQFGDDAVIRVLDRNRSLPGLDELGLSSRVLRRYKALIANPRGLILIAGPAGCGKSTTLYSSLAHLNQGDKEIVSAEDPVEVHIDGIIQYQINDAVGNTFAEYARRFLRKAPDVILIGEIRDAETALACTRAARTGHLVFSTLHANDAIAVIQRLRDLSLDSSSLADALLCVIQQRLARRNCPDCSEPYAPGRRLLREFFGNDGPPPGARFLRGAGCARCHGKGLRGRVGLYEFWELRRPTRQVIEAGGDERSIRRSAVDNGLGGLVEDALEKACQGVTTMEELRRVIPAEQILGYSGYEDAE